MGLDGLGFDSQFPALLTIQARPPDWAMSIVCASATALGPGLGGRGGGATLALHCFLLSLGVQTIPESPSRAGDASGKQRGLFFGGRPCRMLGGERVAASMSPGPGDNRPLLASSPRSEPAGQGGLQLQATVHLAHSEGSGLTPGGAAGWDGTGRVSQTPWCCLRPE